MTDTDKLKRLAEKLLADDDCPMLVPPQTILALIAENERLKVELGGEIERHGDTFENYSCAAHQRDEAVVLLREWGRVGIDPTGGDSLDENTEDFLARIDAKEPK